MDLTVKFHEISEILLGLYVDMFKVDGFLNMKFFIAIPKSVLNNNL